MGGAMDEWAGPTRGGPGRRSLWGRSGRGRERGVGGADEGSGGLSGRGQWEEQGCVGGAWRKGNGRGLL